MTSGLASRLAHTDPRLLLPSHTVSPPERLDLVVAVQLPGSGRELHLLVATDPSGTAHVVPVVDDATGLRRSRPGDGLAAALLRLLAADEDLPGMRLRPGGAAGAGRPGGVEMHLGDGSDHELFAVGSRSLHQINEHEAILFGNLAPRR